MTNKPFDVDKYLEKQKEKILEVMKLNGNKLYMELGGKLIDDYHASRVLPGMKPDTKMQLFHTLKNEAEIVMCICSENIQNERIRSDYNTLYTEDCLRLIEKYREEGFLVSGVALTLFDNQPKAVEFAKKLEEMGEKVYYLHYIPDYPNNFKAIIESFEKNDFIETTRPLVIMTSSGSASGKLSASLSQVYKEFKKGKEVGYAKFDIFPVWDLPINHPLNLAFEAGTADSQDEILVDQYYYSKYHKEASNYNRDLEVFPIVREILMLITGKEVYSSPTEMVINTVREAIVDEEAICKAAREEVCRRCLTYEKQYLRGQSTINPIIRVRQIMDQNKISMEHDLPIVYKARKMFSKQNKNRSIALELENKELLIIDKVEGFSIGAILISTVLNLDTSVFANTGNKINVADILQYIENSEEEKQDYDRKLASLKGLNAHTSYLLSREEEQEITKLGIFVTCEPKLES